MIHDENEDTPAAVARARRLAYIASMTPPLSEGDRVDCAKYKMRMEWEALGFKVCPNHLPALRQSYHVPGRVTPRLTRCCASSSLIASRELSPTIATSLGNLPNSRTERAKVRQLLERTAADAQGFDVQLLKRLEESWQARSRYRSQITTRSCHAPVSQASGTTNFFSA
jgi:hypothetical protein